MKESIIEILDNPSYKIYVTAIISLFIFITGGLIKYLFQKNKEYYKRKDLRRTILILLTNTIDELKTSELNMFNFYKTITVDYNKSWNLIHKQLTYLDTFYEFDFSDIYSAFRKKRKWGFYGKTKKELAFHKFWSLLRIVAFTQTQIEPDLKSMVKKHIDYHNKYKDSLSKFRLNFDHLMMDIDGEKTPAEIDYLKKQNIIWYEWEQLDEEIRTDYNKTYNMVIKPSLELLRSNLRLLVTKTFDKDLLDCTHQYIQLEALLKTYNNQFYNHYLSYRVARKKLTVITKILE